jgi:uncharacterized protein YndB with AHSA1/START domain
MMFISSVFRNKIPIIQIPKVTKFNERRTSMSTNKSKTVTRPSEKEILITRNFNAPRDQVWKAWTDSQQVPEWWGPRGFTARVTQLDLRPGGTWRYVMIGPDGTEYPSKGVFQEIVPPERIVTTDEFDEGFPGDTIQGIVITATFADRGKQTQLTIDIVHQSAEDCHQHEEMGVIDGWNSTLDRLGEFLTKK